MQRLILSALVVALTGGVASADRFHDQRERTVVRDHRSDNRTTVRVQPQRNWDNGRHWDNGRRWENRSRVVVQRQPVYANNNRFYVNGHYHNYYRPVIHTRYYNYRYRPQILVENYDPIPGYIWIQGGWNWNGYEWIWTSGHYQVDPAYTYYDDGGYSYQGTYYPGY
jgi:hypothetical protein